ncbi:MAG: nucleotidyltransferase family protein [Lachnospiraceae bacterium]|nr:nucleotidyltransferase family protein [Lachnospiraceae bacterium]
MKITGIIAEFNPFHNGHASIIDAVKKTAGADYCVVVMSGDFVQRGEPAICDKYLRTRMALASGADAVFELPVIFSCASAEQFAFGAVSLLASLGCIDDFCFGSESGDITLLMDMARILNDEPEEYRDAISEGVRSGFSFPTARQKALEAYLASCGNDTASHRLYEAVKAGQMSSPNNILGIEYCKAYLKLTSQGITVPCPVTIKRTGSEYNSPAPGTDTQASAFSVREMISKGNTDDIGAYVPPTVHSLLIENMNKTFPIYADDFDTVLYSKLLDLKTDISSGKINGFPGIPSDMLGTILKQADEPVSFFEVIERIKHKNYTYTSISRALISIILGIGEASVSYRDNAAVSYARLLGIRKQSSGLINIINKSASCEIINKLADAAATCVLLDCDIRAARLYNQTVYKKFGTRLADEYRKTIELY